MGFLLISVIDSQEPHFEPFLQIYHLCHTRTPFLYLLYQTCVLKYILQINSDQPPVIDPIESSLEAIRGQISALQQQQDKLCEYLEKGIYSVEMFTKRNATVAAEIKQLQSSEAELVQQQNAGDEKEKTTLQIIPTTQHILDNYDILTILEKNQLWKLVLKKVTVYRSQDDELSIQLYPNLPK